MDEIVKMLLSAAGGGFVATWGMLGWTNGRLRQLEIHGVTSGDCNGRHNILDNTAREMMTEIKVIAESVARIEGALGINK
jgi:hypothetical protein